MRSARRAGGVLGLVTVLTGAACGTHTTAGLEREHVRTALASSTGTCGTERWSVKTGTDPDAGPIDLNQRDHTTIASLTSLPKPASLPENNRIKPTETTIFVLDATMTVYKLEDDSDYHLV